jgi:hypothetical protein
MLICRAMAKVIKEPVTVHLTEAQRHYIERIAEQESISMAAVVRRLVGEAVRQESGRPRR